MRIRRWSYEMELEPLRFVSEQQSNKGV